MKTNEQTPKNDKLTSQNWPFPIVNGIPIPKVIKKVVYPSTFEEAPL